MAFTKEQIERVKAFSKEATRDPNDPKTRNVRLATINDLLIDKTNLKTVGIPNPKDPDNVLILKYRKMTFKEMTDIQAKTTKTKFDPKNPTEPEVDITDQQLMTKLMITTQIVEPKISMEQIDEFDPDLIGLIAIGMQIETEENKETKEIKLKNSQSPMKSE